MPTNTEKLVYAFLQDNTFTNRSALIIQGAPTGGTFSISLDRFSYYVDALEIKDPRATRATTFTTTLKDTLIIERADYPDEIEAYTQAPTAEKENFFNIIERLCFKWVSADTVTTLNNLLQFGSAYYGYVPDSLSVSHLTETANAYQDNGVVVPVTAPTWVRFKFKFRIDDGFDTIEFKIWTSNARFGSEYPLSHIVEVANPLDFNTLLYGPLVGGASNPFNISMETATISETKFHPKIRTDDSSGLWVQKIKFYDAAIPANERLVPFTILYKGLKPTIAKIREAIREMVLASGVGTRDQWRARAPELFIENLFYFIPQFNIRTKRVDQYIYPSVAPLQIVMSNTVKALTLYSTDYITGTLEIIAAAYDTLTIASVPYDDNKDPENVLESHRTYRALAPTDPMFMNMTPKTKEFARKLIQVLAVASGNDTSELYEARDEAGNTYIAFTVDYTEYLVMTKESFHNVIGVP